MPVARRLPPCGLATAGSRRCCRDSIRDKLSLHLGAKVKGDPDVVAAALDLVGDLKSPRRPVQPHPATVPGGRGQRAVAVMLRGPAERVSGGVDLDLPAARVLQPQERATVAGLALPGQLDGIVRDRRPEVRPPGRIAVIAVGARISEDIDAAVPDLDGQRVGVRVRGDAEKSMRTSVAPAPDLRCLSRRGPQNRQAGVGEPGRPLRWPSRDRTGRAGQGPDEHGAHVRWRWRAPVQPAEERPAESQQGRPAIGLRSVEQQRPALIAVPLARRP